jgi:hypothetical protein
MEEAFFVPCIRMQNLMRAWNNDHEHTFPQDIDFEEVELRAGVGNDAGDFFHHPDFTFDNFWQLTHRKILWLGPEIFVEALAADKTHATLSSTFASVLNTKLFSRSDRRLVWTSPADAYVRCSSYCSSLSLSLDITSLSK